MTHYCPGARTGLGTEENLFIPLFG